MISSRIDQIILEKSRSEHTEEMYRRVAREIGTFNVTGLRQWWTDLQRKDISDNSRLHYFRVAHSLLKSLTDDGDVSAEQALRWLRSVNKPTETVSVMRKRPLTAAEREKIRNALHDKSAKLALDVLRHTGLRVSTLLALSRQNVVHDHRGWWLSFRTKRKRLVEIPVDGALCRKLLALRGEPWFRWDRKGFWRMIDTTAQRVLKRRVSPHDLRRTFANRVWEESGHDLALTQRMMGHSSFETTRRYILIDADRMRKVARRL